MQEWVFDRDGALTPRSTGTAPAGESPAPAPPDRTRRSRGRRRRWAAAAAAAVAVLGAGVGLAVAAGSPAPETTAAAAPTDADDQGATEGRRTGRLPADPQPDEDATAQEESPTGSTSTRWSALHEEQELQQPDGSTVTIAVQGGTVTALDTGSVTVQSSDGFTRTYAVTSGTRIAGTALAVGDPVLVEAVVDGGTATATTIRPTAGGRGLPGGATSPDTETGTETQEPTHGA
ncbi:hypothetical protein [Blastococcus sp. SYSU DS0828]